MPKLLHASLINSYSTIVIHNASNLVLRNLAVSRNLQREVSKTCRFLLPLKMSLFINKIHDGSMFLSIVIASGLAAKFADLLLCNKNVDNDNTQSNFYVAIEN